MSDSPAAMEAKLARTRSEIKGTVDELSDRLHPRTLAQDMAEEAKIAAADVKRRVTGEPRGPLEPEPSRTGWAVLGTGAFVVILITSKILRGLRG